MTTQTYQLYISDGTTSPDFTASPFALIEYVPAPGTEEMDSVTETATVRVRDGSSPNNLAELREVERLFSKARFRRRKKRGDRVYVYFKETSGSDLYRAMLFDGRVNYSPNWLSRGPWIGDSQIVTISWERTPFYEGPETELSLLSREVGTKQTGGVQIYNGEDDDERYTATTISFSTTQISDSANGLGNFGVGDIIGVFGSTSNDGMYRVTTAAAGALTVTPGPTTEAAGDTVTIAVMDCHVDIAGTDIEGSGPVPIKLVATREAAENLKQMHVAIGWDFDNPDHHLAVLDGAHWSAGAESTFATSWGGEYTTWAITTTEATLAQYTLDSVWAKAAQGRFFHCLLRGAGTSNLEDVRWRVKILESGGTTLWDSGLFSLNQSSAYAIYSLFSIPVPPFDTEGAEPKDLTIQIRGVSATGSGFNALVDTMFLLPTDSYRFVRVRGSAGGNGSAITIDDIDDIVKITYADSTEVYAFSQSGSKLVLQPGEDTRIYILSESGTGYLGSLDALMDVRIYYRPRRYTI